MAASKIHATAEWLRKIRFLLATRSGEEGRRVFANRPLSSRVEQETIARFRVVLTM
jgi:hypothetical protein